jgi:hypothetical protein
MDEIQIRSTSRSSAEAEPIVLRLKDTVRLVFIPTIVENKHDSDACVKGTFVYQKKSKKNQWENIKDINLNSLRPAEGVQLEIKSAELLHLLRKLADLWRIHHREGIPIGKSRYIKISDQLTELDNFSDDELRQFLEVNSATGMELFKRLAAWLAKIDDQEAVLASLESLGYDSLKQLNIIVSLGNLRRSLHTWETFQTNVDEEFWQTELLKNSFLLSQLFAYPVVVIKGKAYVGGKSFENVGGNIVDFLCKNELSNNAVLIEIKTPATPLLGKKYRNVYTASDDLNGGIVQVLNYANSITKDYQSLISSEPKAFEAFEAFKPRCVVIIGNCQRELDSPDKRKSFELFRGGLKDVEILTYDELFGKVRRFVSLLEKGR